MTDNELHAVLTNAARATGYVTHRQAAAVASACVAALSTTAGGLGAEPAVWREKDDTGWIYYARDTDPVLFDHINRFQTHRHGVDAFALYDHAPPRAAEPVSPTSAGEVADEIKHQARLMRTSGNALNFATRVRHIDNLIDALTTLAKPAGEAQPVVHTLASGQEISYRTTEYHECVALIQLPPGCVVAEFRGPHRVVEAARVLSLLNRAQHTPEPAEATRGASYWSPAMTMDEVYGAMTRTPGAPVGGDVAFDGAKAVKLLERIVASTEAWKLNRQGEPVNPIARSTVCYDVASFHELRHMLAALAFSLSTRADK